MKMTEQAKSYLKQKAQELKQSKKTLKADMYSYLLNHASKDIAISFQDYFRLCANNKYSNIAIEHFQQIADDFLNDNVEYYSSLR